MSIGEIGARIERLRAARGMPHDPELAQIIGISARTLYSALRGSATRRTLQKLALAEQASQTLAKSADVLQEPRPGYSAGSTVGKITGANFHQLEDHVEKALDALMEIRKEIRRMKT